MESDDALTSFDKKPIVIVFDEDLNDSIGGADHTNEQDYPVGKKSRMDTDLWSQFSEISPPPNTKSHHYKCIHCDKSFAKNITRMRMHLNDCRKCPEDVKEILNLGTQLSPPRDQYFQNAGDHLSNEEKELQVLFVKALYASGIPLTTFTKNSYWKEFFNQFQPNFIMPSDTQLTTTLVDHVNYNVTEDVNKRIVEAKMVSISCKLKMDGVNINLFTPKPIFFKKILEDRQTTDSLVDHISQIIEFVGRKKCLGVCSDNDSRVIKAWKILEEKYVGDKIIFYRCSRHILDLILSDILNHPINNKILKSAVNVIKNSKLKSLRLPTKTCLKSSLKCLDSLLKNKQVLINFVDDNFWSDVSALADLIRPIVEYATRIEQNPVTLSILPEILYKLQNHLNIKRFELILRPIHYAANILDPHRKGCDLNSEQYVQGSLAITRVAEKLNLDKNLIIQQLGDYAGNRGYWGQKFVQDSLSALSIHLWWKSCCKPMELSKVAIEILNLPCKADVTEKIVDEEDPQE